MIFMLVVGTILLLQWAEMSWARPDLILVFLPFWLFVVCLYLWMLDLVKRGE